MNVEELTRLELEAEIAEVEEQIETKTAELDEVRALLNKESISDIVDDEFEEDEIDDEIDDELDDELEEDEEVDEDFEDEEETFEEDEEDEEDEDFDEELDEEQLLEKEATLSEEILVLQMRLVALNKRLNDILANEGMEALAEEEE